MASKHMSCLLSLPQPLAGIAVRNVLNKSSQQWSCTHEGFLRRGKSSQTKKVCHSLSVLASTERSSDRAINKNVVAKSMTDEVYKYILDHNAEPQVMGELRNETAELNGSKMQVAPEQGRFMSWLVETMQVKRALEVGVYTGYSSLAVAMALPDDGVLYAIDQDEKSMKVARKYWERANMSHKVEERLGNGVGILEELVEEEGEGSIDFAFIDANKQAYDQYYELCLKLLRVGGVVGIDNTLWGGDVANPEDKNKTTIAIRKLNDKIAVDPRVSCTMLQIGDGLTLCRKL